MPAHAFIDQLLDNARKDGERTALDIAINAVDIMLARATDLNEFKDMWLSAKALYEEMRVD